MAGRLPEPVTRLRRWAQGLPARQQRLLDAAVFLTLFAALSAPLYLLLSAGWEAPVLRRGSAAAAAAVLQAVGIEAWTEGTRIVTREMVLVVTRDSTGWKSLLAVAALVVASRKGWRATAVGVVAGLGVVLGANVLRLASMVVGVVVFSVPYQVMHQVLWRWGLAVVVLATWLAWLRWTGPGR